MTACLTTKEILVYLLNILPTHGLISGEFEAATKRQRRASIVRIANILRTVEGKIPDYTYCKSRAYCEYIIRKYKNNQFEDAESLGNILPERTGRVLVERKKTVTVNGVDVTLRKFLYTYEWRQLRYRALKLYGAKCMCCGGKDKIVVDHIKPRFKYPELALDFDNLQILCDECNHGKGRDDETDWRSGQQD